MVALFSMAPLTIDVEEDGGWNPCIVREVEIKLSPGILAEFVEEESWKWVVALLVADVLLMLVAWKGEDNDVAVLLADVLSIELVNDVMVCVEVADGIAKGVARQADVGHRKGPSAVGAKSTVALVLSCVSCTTGLAAAGDNGEIVATT